MTDMARLLLMLGLAGTAVTFLGSAALWFQDENRRILRALRRVMRAEPEAVLVARGRGRGVGLSFSTGRAAVAWDRGDWCLVYRIDELTGAELRVDGQVVARAFRGEPRRPLDQVVSSAREVTLRLLFDDPRYPDFDLDLWLTGDEARRDDWSPSAAIQEANRWVARAESIIRRPPVAPPAPPSPPPPVTVRAPAPDPDPEPDEIFEPEPPPRPRQARRPAAPAVEEPELPWDDDDFDN